MYIQLNPEERKSRLNHYVIKDVYGSKITTIKYHSRPKNTNSNLSLNNQIIQNSQNIPSINGKELSFQFPSQRKASKGDQSKLTLEPICKKSSKQSNQQINHYYKTNSIRNQNNQVKYQIMTMQARINKIKNQNQKNRRKTMRSKLQMDKLLQSKYNSLEKQRRKNDYLKKLSDDQFNRTQSIRLIKKMSKQALQLSKSRLRQQRQLSAKIKRQARLKQQNQVKFKKKKSIQSNQTKAYEIKMYQIEQAKIKQLSDEHSKTRARSNHNEKVAKYLKEKRNLQKKVNSLRKTESRLMTQFMKQTGSLREIQAKIEIMRKNSKSGSFFK